MEQFLSNNIFSIKNFNIILNRTNGTNTLYTEPIHCMYLIDMILNYVLVPGDRALLGINLGVVVIICNIKYNQSNNIVL
jgi:hypothetical protein